MAFSDPGIGRQVIVSPGPAAATVTVAEAVKEGDILGYSSGWKRALATAGGVIQGRLVALADTKSGGVCPVAQFCVVDGYSGATPGALVYVAEGTDYGKVTTTQPSSAGDLVLPIGIAITSTVIAFALVGALAPSAAITNAPAGGTGQAAGAWDTAEHRDAAIAAINNIIATLEAHGIILKD